MTPEDVIDRLAEQAGENAKRDAIAGFWGSVNMLRGECESPIELLMFAAIVSTGWSDICRMALVWPKEAHPLFQKHIDAANSEHLDNEVATPLSCIVVAQFQIDNYRADLCLAFYGGVKIVVECDGHQWHERTPEQAQRDRSRDRAIQAAGFQVLRFTGREIWRDPERCAREVFLAAEREWHRRLDAREDAR